MRLSRKISKESISGVVVCAAMAALVAPAMSVAQEALQYSHVRIVRLSFAEGKVTVLRAGSADWSTATANTPLEDGMKLSTGEDGFAEVEFENGSTARIGQLSILVFTQLVLMPSGGKVSHMTLERGYATFHVRPEGDDVYEVKAGGAAFTPDGKSEFRIDVDDPNLRAEVFRGALGTLDPSWSGSLAKNDVLVLSPGTDQPFSLTQGITQDDWDKWVAERDTVQAQTGGGPAPAPGAGLYGWNDLYQYGDWNFVPGYGYGWFPDVAFGWAPYTMGRWAFYPGFGLTWISAEPWGWLPYHCGGWMSDPSFGWFWMPDMGGCNDWLPALVTWYQGPGWTGWYPRPPRHPPHPPLPPPRGRGGLPHIAVVKNSVIEHGELIRLAGYKAVDLAEERGQAVTKLEIEPTRLASLPGSPTKAPTARVVPGWREVSANGEPAPARPHSFAAPAPSARLSGGAEGGAPVRGSGRGAGSGQSSGFSSFANSGRGTSGSHSGGGGWGGDGSSHGGGGYSGGGLSGGGHASSGGGSASGGGGGHH